MKPVHTACTSKAAPCVTPSFACNRQAVEGMTMSGVVVAQTIRSTSAAVTPAASIARRQACSARSLVISPSAATCRDSSLVSMRLCSSALETLRAGR